jgi:hypothetical protein
MLPMRRAPAHLLHPPSPPPRLPLPLQSMDSTMDTASSNPSSTIAAPCHPRPRHSKPQRSQPRAAPPPPRSPRCHTRACRSPQSPESACHVTAIRHARPTHGRATTGHALPNCGFPCLRLGPPLPCVPRRSSNRRRLLSLVRPQPPACRALVASRPRATSSRAGGTSGCAQAPCHSATIASHQSAAPHRQHWPSPTCSALEEEEGPRA